MFQIVALPVLSLELDMSVDEEIRKKYDSSKLENAVLPPLPKVDNVQTKPVSQTTSATTVPKVTPTYTTSSTPQVTPTTIKSGKKLSAWTTFEVKSNQKISDWSSVGSSVSFTSTVPVYKNGLTIPSGTVFHGTISNSHRPQVSGNGGLVVIKISSMTCNGKNFPVKARITKANAKNIFLNNIKGKHQYWDNVGKQIDKGENFYNKTRKTSNKLASNPIGVIISPVPTVVGWVGYAVTTVVSPVTGFFSKGGSISIPSGTGFEIRLTENAYIY